MDKNKTPHVPPFETPLLDLDFDETDEQVLEQPPLYSPRRNGKLIRLDIDPADDD